MEHNPKYRKRKRQDSDLEPQRGPTSTFSHISAHDSSQQHVGHVFNITNLGDPNSEHGETLRWLAPRGYESQIQKLNKLRDETATDTGRWVLRDLLPTWLDPLTEQPPSVRSLWLRGPVGCGKSVACSTIIRELNPYLANTKVAVDGRNTVAFLLFAFDDAYTHDPIFILRFLLLQLCTGVHIPDEIIHMHKHNALSPSEENFRSTLFSILNRLQRERQELDSSEDKSGSEGHPQVRSLTVVIDGMDELPTVRIRTAVLRLVEDLQTFGQASPDFPLRIAMCSRDNDDIKTICTRSAGWLQVEMPIEEIRADVKAMARDRIRKHIKMRNMPESKAIRLCDKIADAAKDMFRLAALWMDELCESDMPEIPDAYLKEELLSKLPKDLPKFYDCILKRVKQQSMRNDMFVILKWILVAARPLTVAELTDACATLPSEGSEFSRDRRITCQGFLGRLVGLINVNPLLNEEEFPLGASYVESNAEALQLRTVTLAHFSVKEYLLAMEQPLGWNSSQLRYDIGLSQSYAAQCCLAYLVECKRDPLGRTDAWPFRTYAWQYWAMHAALSDSDCGPCTSINRLQKVALVETQPSTQALRLFNLASCPFLHHHKEAPEQTEKLMQSAGRVPNAAEFRSRYSEVLQDPEFVYHFSEDDLRSASRRPLYTPGGSPDHAIQLPKPVPMDEWGIHDRPRVRPKFRFLPLVKCPSTIRLAVLHSSPFATSTIVCSLYTETLDNLPCYTALSYNWYYGDDPDETILVNGRECCIRSNLAAALRELRSESQTKVLWIDAICMSMKDLIERGSQVRLMDRIYHSAEEVVLWLGPAIGNSDHIMRDLADYGQICAGNQENHANMLCTSLEYCLASLFEHKIWKKTWILLEVVLASKVTIAYGSKRLDWTSLSNSLSTPSIVARMDLDQHKEQNDQYSMSWQKFEIYDQLRKNWRQSRYLTLPELLYRTRHFEVSDAKDKILTMIHLLNPKDRREVLPLMDYNLSVIELNVAVAKYCFSKLGNLSILSINIAGRSERPSLYRRYTMSSSVPNAERIPDYQPSWAPTWHSAHWTNPLYCGNFAPNETCIYNAGDLTSKVTFTIDGRILSTQGFFVGQIDTLLYRGGTEYCLDSFILDVCRSAKVEKAFIARYGAGSAQLADVVRRTCVADRAADWSRLPQGSLPLSPCLEYDESEFERSLRSVGEGFNFERRIGFTSEGHLGLLPSWSEAGDYIVVLLGAAVPYVVRKTSRGRCELVGDCYVHGIMDGEVLREAAENGLHGLHPIAIE